MALKTTRRRLLSSAAVVLAGGAIAGPAVFARRSRAGAPPPPRRFVQICLEGGWNSLFATDPVVGSKRGTANFESVFLSSELDPRPVAGKPALLMGPGLFPAAGAFARMPTAFVNGLFMEVSSHDFGTQYISSGILSLSNTRDYPAIPARLGALSRSFPPHVVIGTGVVPLGDTRFTSPPLQAASNEALSAMVNGPSIAAVPPGILQDHFNPALIADAHALIDSLDTQVIGTLPAAYQQDLALWRQSSRSVDDIYRKNLGTRLAPTEALMARYGIASSFEIGPEISLASALLLLQADLSPFITVTFGSFDTHSDELAAQLPLQQRFARALAIFVDDLLATDDPSQPGTPLAETTTILITSEFVRTPLFTPATGGTEHWPSASVILMGAGVNDGVVIGATDDAGLALGWEGTRAAPVTETNTLLPDHLVATILAKLGNDEVADEVSTTRITGLMA